MRLVGKKKTLPTLHKSLSYARVQYILLPTITTGIVYNKGFYKREIEPNEN
jgi:hypothetical protein